MRLEKQIRGGRREYCAQAIRVLSPDKLCIYVNEVGSAVSMCHVGLEKQIRGW